MSFRGKKKLSRVDRKKKASDEIESLKTSLSRHFGSVADVNSAESVSSSSRYFSDLPLSRKTMEGLEAAHFVEMTEIQKLTLPASLSGRDVLGGAETGSGKTLSFLIPLLEKLHLNGWSPHDGLGALVLAPTRELAMQIFQVLRKIGTKHSFSAGLIIGGKDLKSEREAIVRMNILIATPGRLLQHMDQAAGFEWGNLQFLALDEADRILDLGFSKTVDAIIRALPSSDSRQTLLFSATQSASIQSLARLSLRDPLHISTRSLRSFKSEIGGISKLQTPKSLNQFVLFSSLPNKIDHLWSFVKQHINQKTIVFVSSCKQVRFLYESLCRLQPGVPLLHLHGKQKQLRRMTVFSDFCKKKAALLIATDIAARGLDFPAVDWVVQLDCPEDAETYVHRAGRTARYESTGNSLLFLLPSEVEMLKALRDNNSLSITGYQNRNELESQPRLSIKNKLQSLCSQNPDLKYLAQKALVSYVRSVYLNKNKQVFSVESLPIDDFAIAIGLPGTPKLRFIERQTAAKNMNRDLTKSLTDLGGNSEDEESDSENDKPIRVADKTTTKRSRNSNICNLTSDNHVSSDSDDQELLQIKRRNIEIADDEYKPIQPTALSRRDILKTKKKYRLKHNDERPTKLVFDPETGVSKEQFPFQPEEEFDHSKVGTLSSSYIHETKQALASADVDDKERVKSAHREKRLEKKRKAKQRDNENTKTDVHL